jgi:predicted DNA-binding transcriptional regulator AlpA
MNKREIYKEKDINEKTIWKVDDVAEFLSCSKKHIYELSRLGKIPSIKKGKFRYYVPSDIENWLLE